MRLSPRCLSLALSAILLSSPSPATLIAQDAKPTPKLAAMDLERGHMMLRQTYDEVRKNYYDPAFHGVDLDASYRKFDAMMNSAGSVNESFRVIAAFLLELHDTHTFFQPPMRANRSTLGYDLQMIGDHCYITHVRPGTDAFTRLHVGDEVLAINNYKVTRADLPTMLYFFHTLSPAPAETLDLQSPSGERRRETVQALLRRGKNVLSISDNEDGGDFWSLVRSQDDLDHLNRQRLWESGDVIVWKMPSFFMDNRDLDQAFNKVRKHQTLVLDLRGNPGGSVDVLKDMLAHVFDHSIKIADTVSRKDTKPLQTKGPAGAPFTGKLVVLVDSDSGSCAELFARVIQLEKRGQVIGDRSAGAVMEARGLNESLGTDYKIFWGLSVTSANLLMSDGKSLEHVGVTPDAAALPTATDLAEGNDPVLARVVSEAGVSLPPRAAGGLFPFEWPPL